MPSYYKMLYQNSVNARIIASVIQSITPSLRGLPEEDDMLVKGIESWVISLGFMNKLGDIGIDNDSINEIVDKLFKNVKLIEVSKHLRQELTKDIPQKILNESITTHL